MLTVATVRGRAATLAAKQLRSWAVDGGADAVFDVSLHPPTEREAFDDQAGAIAWARSWDGVDGVTWETRRWASMGGQRLPIRCTLEGADAILRFAGRVAERDGRLLRSRVQAFVARFFPAEPSSDVFPAEPTTVVVPAEPTTEVFPAEPSTEVFPEEPTTVGGSQVAGAPDSADASRAAESRLPEAVAVALRRHGGAILALDPDDFARLLDVLEWLRDHPGSGLRIRQLPIRGVDTKWAGAHRGLVSALHLALTERESLGLTTDDVRVRIRILDPELRGAGGLVDITAPIAELARLELRPARVLVVENLETLLSLGDLAGTIAVFGGGFGAGSRLAALTWASGPGIDVVYWGDLDSHGFAILDQLRASVPGVRSILMDLDTLNAHRDLWVSEPKPTAAALSRLTDAEAETLAALRASGNPRLEQERIPWTYVTTTLTQH